MDCRTIYTEMDFPFLELPYFTSTCRQYPRPIYDTPTRRRTSMLPGTPSQTHEEENQSAPPPVVK